MRTPYRDPHYARLIKLPNEHTYVRADEVMAIEEQADTVVLALRNGLMISWESDNPAELAREIADTINQAPS
jgi:hypothetical protein